MGAPLRGRELEDLRRDAGLLRLLVVGRTGRGPVLVEDLIATIDALRAEMDEWRRVDGDDLDAARAEELIRRAIDAPGYQYALYRLGLAHSLHAAGRLQLKLKANSGH